MLIHRRQEDKLFEWCKEIGASWNVVRPSYIIGAVRDNQLNYMFGFAVYASVCAHLKQPLKFPGDYLAWDKEFCESSAMLNSFLSEWASRRCTRCRQVRRYTDEFEGCSDRQMCERSIQCSRRFGLHLVPLLAIPG